MKAPDSLGTLQDQGRKDLTKPTKRDALLAKDAARTARRMSEAIWRKAVDARDAKDGFVCRWSGKKIARTIELRPDRAERHHLESRRNRSTRFDVRNGILVSLSTHQRFEAHELTVIAGQTFHAADGNQYWNADAPLQVLDASTGITRWI